MEIVLRRQQIILAAFFIFSIAFANDDNEPFEIVERKVFLQIFPSSVSVKCIDTVTIHLMKQGLAEIKFRLPPIFEVSNVTIRGKKKAYNHIREFLTVNDIPTDSVFSIVISYNGRLPERSEFTFIQPDYAVLRDEEILPFGNRSIRFARISVKIPSLWQAIAVGTLVGKYSMGDSVLYVWEVNERVNTLGWVCAGKFQSDSLYSDNVQISLHTFSDDTIDASLILRMSADVLNFFSGKFTPYRFSKLAIIEVDDWFGGRNILAAAFPSGILVKKFSFNSIDRFNHILSILPHEIAHQWWPLTVFIEDYDAAFLSEGMCEYSAIMFNNARGNPSKRDSLQNHPLLHTLISRAKQGKDVPLQQKADLRYLQTHYLKSAYVHNMLRWMIGDSLFLLLYKNFAQRYSQRKVTLEDFQTIVDELSGQPYQWFFDQWVRGKGIPKLKLYNVKSLAVEQGWKTTGRVRIVGYEKFTTPVDVSIETDDGMFITRVWLGMDNAGIYRNDVGFNIITTSKPRRARIDPGGELLKLQNIPVKLGVLREPTEGVFIIGTIGNPKHLVDIARKDSVEMEKAGWSIEIKYDTSVTLGDLQNERVFLYGRSSENMIIADIGNKFPIVFRGDSVIVRDEVVYDKTLALIQIIENPFLPQGYICWIAPFSSNAKPVLLPYDASWILVREQDEIASGVWDVKDNDLVIKIE